jgi:hypothetical protein
MFIDQVTDVTESLHLGTQISAGAIAVFIIQLLKKWEAVPWISNLTPRVNRLVAIVGAFCSAIGVHVAYSSVQHTLLISGLTLTGILGMGWVWVKQFALQEWIYQSAANRTKVDLPKGGVLEGQRIPPGGALEIPPPQVAAVPEKKP